MEWTIPDQDVGVRQGDILVNRPPPGKPPHRMLLVVTADCDLANNKYGSHIACLRVAWYGDFIRDEWSAEEMERTRVGLATQIGDQMRAAHKAASGATSSISNTRALEWLEEATPDEIADALSVLPDSRERFVTNLSKPRAALVAAMGRNSALQRLAALKATLDSSSVEAAALKLVEKARGAKLPDDVFLLPGVPGFEERPAVVLLRHLVAVPASDVVLTRHDAVRDAHCIRVGRLLETYKYAISQAFGHLYARIGLPAKFEERLKLARAAIKQEDCT